MTTLLGYKDANFFDGRMGPLFLLLAPFTIWILVTRTRRDSPEGWSLFAIGVFSLFTFAAWTIGVVNSSALWQARLLLPALAVGLIAGFAPSAATATGLLLIAACPIGGISNFYSHLARASTALSVVLTGSSCLLATLTIPALSAIYKLALARPLGLDAPLPLFFVQISFMVLLPVAVGMWVKRRWPDGVESAPPAAARPLFRPCRVWRAARSDLDALWKALP